MSPIRSLPIAGLIDWSILGDDPNKEGGQIILALLPYATIVCREINRLEVAVQG